MYYHLHFNNGTLGQVAQGSGGFTDAAGHTYYTNARSYEGGKAVEMNIEEGVNGFGTWGGILQFPQVLDQNAELWVRMRINWPAGFTFEARPWLKFMRVRTENAAGDSTAYDDWYITPPSDSSLAPHRFIFEGEQVWETISAAQSDRPQYDTWETYEWYIKFDDTPYNSGGQARVRCYKDGRLLSDIKTRRTWGADRPRIWGFYIFTYWNESDGTGAPKTQKCYVDDVIVTNERPTTSYTDGFPWIGGGTTAPSRILFRDGLESGDFSHVENGIAWGGTSFGKGGDFCGVSTDRAKTGAYGIKFQYAGGASGDDAWAEQRVLLNRRMSELWVGHELYIPSNYTHRADNPNNNKFMALYPDPYPGPGFHLVLQLVANGSGGSNIGFHDHITPDTYPPLGRDFITSADFNKWMTIIVRVKVPTSYAANNGIVQVWKNGKLALDISNARAHQSQASYYMDQFYLLGWANSGFANTTTLYIDDVIVSDTSLLGAPAPTPVPKRPNPPSGFTVT